MSDLPKSLRDANSSRSFAIVSDWVKMSRLKSICLQCKFPFHFNFHSFDKRHKNENFLQLSTWTQVSLLNVFLRPLVFKLIFFATILIVEYNSEAFWRLKCLNYQVKSHFRISVNQNIWPKKFRSKIHLTEIFDQNWPKFRKFWPKLNWPKHIWPKHFGNNVPLYKNIVGMSPKISVPL